MGIKSSVLVLNASYEPINICGARRALTLLVKGVARLEEAHDLVVYRDLRLPSVIRLNRYRRVPVLRQMVSRRNIFLRDRQVCQYCGLTFAVSKLTIDHVLPRSRGGGDSWENLVTACHPCNRRKADKTPDEARMPLMGAPRAPRTLTLHGHRLHMMGSDDPKWQKYLFQ